MTTHNTSSDAANTAVRAYLTTLGEKYLGHGFNTGSGKGKRIWEEIKESFLNRCAYCDQEPNRLTIEHLVSFNSGFIQLRSTFCLPEHGVGIDFVLSGTGRAVCSRGF